MGDYLLMPQARGYNAGMSWLFVATFVQALLSLFWESPEDRELQRQLLEWAREKFPKKNARSVTDADKNL